MVMCRRTPMRISEMMRSSSCSSQNLLTLAMVAGMETGYTVSSGRRKASVLLRMPLTRHEFLFLGPGTLGRGGGAVLRSDLVTILRSVSLGAPGSSLETRSNRVMACWIWRLDCFTVWAGLHARCFSCEGSRFKVWVHR